MIFGDFPIQFHDFNIYGRHGPADAPESHEHEHDKDGRAEDKRHREPGSRSFVYSTWENREMLVQFAESDNFVYWI